MRTRDAAPRACTPESLKTGFPGTPGEFAGAVGQPTQQAVKVGVGGTVEGKGETKVRAERCNGHDVGYRSDRGRRRHLG